MAEYRITTPDGRTFAVTAPDGTPKEDVLAWARLNAPQDQPSPLAPAPTLSMPPTQAPEPGLFTSPKGYLGPGVMANLASRLSRYGAPKGTKGVTPQEAYDTAIPRLLTMADVAAIFALPPSMGNTFLKRLGVGAGIPAVLSALGGHTPGQIAEQGTKGGLSQLAAEAIFSLARLPVMGRLAETARAENIAQNKALTVAHTQALQTHANQAASEIMNTIKAKVPAWQGLPSDGKGLIDAVVGQGQDLLSKRYDAALKEVVQRGKGVEILLPTDDIKALKVPLKGFQGDPFAGKAPGSVNAQGRSILDANAAQMDLTMGRADAGAVAQAATGLWQRDRALYRRVTEALDKAGVGDPAARAEYKAGMGLIDFVDESGAIRGRALDPEKLVDSLYKVKTVDALRDRGLGDVYTGLMQPARGAPPTPQPIPSPDETKAIREWKLPGTRFSRGALTGAGMGALGGLFGLSHGSPGLHGVGAGAIGYGLGASLPDKIPYRAPMSPEMGTTLDILPLLLGTGIRGLQETPSEPMPNVE